MLYSLSSYCIMTIMIIVHKMVVLLMAYCTCTVLLFFLFSVVCTLIVFVNFKTSHWWHWWIWWIYFQLIIVICCVSSWFQCLSSWFIFWTAMWGCSVVKCCVSLNRWERWESRRWPGLNARHLPSSVWEADATALYWAAVSTEWWRICSWSETHLSHS